MKVRTLTVAAILMCTTMLTSSCVGSFSLFNKLASWNRGATDNKFLSSSHLHMLYARLPTCWCSTR